MYKHVFTENSLHGHQSGYSLHYKLNNVGRRMGIHHDGEDHNLKLCIHFIFFQPVCNHGQ